MAVAEEAGRLDEIRCFRTIPATHEAGVGDPGDQREGEIQAIGPGPSTATMAITST